MPRCLGSTHLAVRAAALAVMGVAVAIAWPATLVSAHGSTPVPDQVFYESVITGGDTPLAGVHFRVDPRGEWLELTSTAADPVVVLGYLGEPYLRVGPSGVEENTLSPTVKLNESLFTDAMPDGSPPGDHAPVWKRTATKPSVRWHDHRIHWMSADRPPKVAADPVHRHLIGEWTVYLRDQHGQPASVRGTLSWTGKPDDSLLGSGVIRAVGTTFALILVAVCATIWMRRRGVTMTEPPTTLEAEPDASSPEVGHSHQ